jgi:hypothetical protein
VREPQVDVQFFGGSLHGQTRRVEAAEDNGLIGFYPAQRTLRVVGGEFYDRQHRGGQWLYVLHGTPYGLLPPETDPLLEAVTAHIRREWPTKQLLRGLEAVAVATHEHGGEELRRYIEGKLLAKLHKAVQEQDGMAVMIEGPRWVRDPDDPIVVCSVEATVLPRFGGKRTGRGW